MRVRMTLVYSHWINALKDRAGRARIQMRVDRLVHGNPGQSRNLTHGVSELKVDFGPGYRVYYTERGGELIILLLAVTSRPSSRTLRPQSRREEFRGVKQNGQSIDQGAR